MSIPDAMHCSSVIDHFDTKIYKYIQSKGWRAQVDVEFVQLKISSGDFGAKNIINLNFLRVALVLSRRDNLQR